MSSSSSSSLSRVITLTSDSVKQYSNNKYEPTTDQQHERVVDREAILTTPTPPSSNNNMMKRLSQLVEPADVKLQRMKGPHSPSNEVALTGSDSSMALLQYQQTVNNNEQQHQQVEMSINRHPSSSVSQPLSLVSSSSTNRQTTKTTAAAAAPANAQLARKKALVNISNNNNDRWWYKNNKINNNNNNNNCNTRDKNSYVTIYANNNNNNSSRQASLTMKNSNVPITTKQRRHSDLPYNYSSSNNRLSSAAAAAGNKHNGDNHHHYYNYDSHFPLCNQHTEAANQTAAAAKYQLKDGTSVGEEDDDEDQSITPTPQLYNSGQYLATTKAANCIILDSRRPKPHKSSSSYNRQTEQASLIKYQQQFGNNNNLTLKSANSCQSGLIKPILLSPFKGLVRQHRISVPCDLTSASHKVALNETQHNYLLLDHSNLTTEKTSPKKGVQRNSSSGSRFNFITGDHHHHHHHHHLTNNKAVADRIQKMPAATTSETGCKLIPETGYKIVVFGASGVGKTSIIKRFMYDVFDLKHRPTVEDNFFIEFPFEKYLFNINVTDTSGTYQFPAMRRLAINSGDAFILVYSVDDPESFEELTRIHDMIVEERQQAYEHSQAYLQMVASSTPRSSDSGISCTTCQLETHQCSAHQSSMIEQHQQQRLDMNATPVNICSHGHLINNHQYPPPPPQHVSSSSSVRHHKQQQQQQHTNITSNNSSRLASSTDLSPIKSLPTDSASDKSEQNTNQLSNSISTTSQQEDINKTPASVANNNGSNSSSCNQSITDGLPIVNSSSCYCGESNCGQLLCRVACNIKKFSKVVGSRYSSSSSLSMPPCCDHYCNEFANGAGTGGGGGGGGGNTNSDNISSSRKSSRTTYTSTTTTTTSSRKSSAASATEAYLRTRRTLKPPMVIVANKTDLPTDQHLVDSNSIEALVLIDWDNGFCRASARNNDNISEIFQKLLLQAKQPPTMAEALISERRRSLPPMPMSKQQRNMATKTSQKHRYYKFVRSLVLSSLRPLSRNSGGGANENQSTTNNGESSETNNKQTESIRQCNEQVQRRNSEKNLKNCKDDDRRQSYLMA